MIESWWVMDDIIVAVFVVVSMVPKSFSYHSRYLSYLSLTTYLVKTGLLLVRRPPCRVLTLEGLN